MEQILRQNSTYVYGDDDSVTNFTIEDTNFSCKYVVLHCTSSYIIIMMKIQTFNSILSNTFCLWLLYYENVSSFRYSNPKNGFFATSNELFYNTKSKSTFTPKSSPLFGKKTKDDYYKIEYQSDSSLFGRGDMHLSAVLEEGDIVVYQTGTWYVDGVEVGDGNPPCFNYCVIDSMQIVWTHNCEHGFIRGMAMDIIHSTDDSTTIVKTKSPEEFIDFGPEQLIARLPVEWINDEEAELLIDIPEELINSS